jgi:hypothetical protein
MKNKPTSEVKVKRTNVTIASLKVKNRVRTAEKVRREREVALKVGK